MNNEILENYGIHNGPDYVRPKFEEVFDLEKCICKLAITNPRDIAMLYAQYRICIESQDKDVVEVWMYPNYTNLHEGASITALKAMERAYKNHMQGVLEVDIPFRQCAGTFISTSKGRFKSAINAKMYNADEYSERIKAYNLKRGLMMNCLDFDGDLSAAEIDRVCDGLKTYESKDVFPEVFFNKVKMEYYGKLEVTGGDE